MTSIKIAEPSVKSLLIQMSFQGQAISTGTGFLVDTAKGMTLITNLHNVTGRNPETGKALSPTGAIPDEIVIIHNCDTGLGNWVDKRESLLDANGSPLWIEHPLLGNKADFAALLLTQRSGINEYPYDVNNTGPDIMVGPADSVSVVGFPFGIQAGGSLAIWATGFMASEPDINFNGLPVVLIDCRSRQGQSGSAVISYISGGGTAMRDGSTAVFSQPVTKFIGIYSGRINAQSDLGIVWKAAAIKKLVDTIQ